MSLRRAVVLCVLAGMTACSRTPDRPTVTSPSAPSVIATAPGGSWTLAPGALLTAPVPPAGKFDAVFPARNLALDFLLRLDPVYVNVLRQGPTALFVNVEGQAVWIQELARYIANGCDFTTSVQRVFAQIDGGVAGPLCAPPPSTAIVQFPPRDIVLAFILLLDQKYQQLGHPAFLSNVDREGIVIWLLEYLRYFVNGCTHEESIANVLIRITSRVGPPPVCRKDPCLYQPSDHPRPGSQGGTFTILMFRREGSCDWTAKSQSDFITLGTSSGTFSGPLTFTVSPNNTGQSRRGTILVEWENGSTQVTIDQAGFNNQLNIQLFDFNKQSGETSECDVVLPSHQCVVKVISGLANGIATYSWSAVYVYGAVQKNPSQPGSDTFVITEACGGAGSTADGLVAEVVITLNVVDTAGNGFSVTTGQNGHPSKYFRFRT